MIWQVPRIWEGGEVWILGGGPSVTKQFNIPDAIVDCVRSGERPPSIYSPYMKAIHNKHVIAINAAYLIGDWMDMVFFGDANFYLPHEERLAKWPKLKVSCHATTANVPWIKFLDKDTNHSRGISSNPGMVSWNTNSGSAAISIAANAGAKRIVLLGFDMSLDSNGFSHWHSEYKNSPRNSGIPPKPNPKDSPFHKHITGFHQIAIDAKLRGIEILNASPESVITELRKVNVKDIL
jgi:hypothetical protein